MNCVLGEVGHTFIRSAGNKNLGLDIKTPAKLRAIVFLEGLTKTDTALRVGVVVCSYGVERFSCCVLDPLRRGKVHVALTEIDAVRGEIRSTFSR